MNKETKLKACCEAFEAWLVNEHGVQKIEGIEISALANMTNPQLLAGFQAGYKAAQAQLQAEVERLRGALQFYAKLENYMAELKPPPVGFDFKHTPIHMDCGEIAKAAL